MLMPATSRERWLVSLADLARREDLHGLLAGRLVRLLHDARRLDDDAVAGRLSQALSVGTTPPEKAAWVDGLLAGTGTVIVHDDGSSPSSTAGCAGSTTTTSRRCCRCCGGPSAGSPRPSGGRLGRLLAGLARAPYGRGAVAPRATRRPGRRRGRSGTERGPSRPSPRSRGCWGWVVADDVVDPGDEGRRRWRLVLGEEGGRGGLGGLGGEDARMDRALGALYDGDGQGGSGGPGAYGDPGGPPGRPTGGRRGGLGPSAPSVATWLGDIRRYFPSTVVQVMQRDAVDGSGCARCCSSRS